MEKQEKFVIQLNSSENYSKEKNVNNYNDEKIVEHPTSDFGAFLHIIKSSLGAGILAMPFAFKNAGLVLSGVGAVVIGIIITHTTAMLINSAQRLGDIFNKHRLSYADTAEYACLHGFKGKFKHHASKARSLANFFLFFTYYGINICYVLIIAETFKQVLEKNFAFEYNLRWYTFGALFFIYPVSIIRWMKFLVPFSALANTFLVVSLVMIFWEIFKGLPTLDSRPAVVSMDRWPIFMATVFLGMEGVGTIMPVENEMKYPRRLTNKPGLLYYGMALVILMNTAVGFFGYLKYGENSKAAISLNLPDDWLSEVVKITIVLVILFTFGLQLTVSIKVVWDNVKKPTDTDDGKFYYVIRSILIIGTVTIATILPSLKGLLSLMGSIGFPTIGVLGPALIELTYKSTNHSGLFQWYVIKDILLILFSILCSVVGLYCSILEIIDST